MGNCSHQFIALYTFSGLGGSFFSFCSFRFKLNSLAVCSHGAIRLVLPTVICLIDEFDFLCLFFANNGFPLTLFNSLIKKFLRFVLQSDVVSSVNKFYFTLPYFGAQSEKMKSELSILLHKFFSDVDLHIILVNVKIGSFFNFNDKLPLAMRSSLV